VNTFASNYTIVKISDLKEHEEINKEVLMQLKNKIISDQMLKRAIAVDKNTNVVLDGHHRLNALKEFGYSKIPVSFVDYRLPEIQVQAWRIGEKITKSLVVNAALSGERLPPKTSRHMIFKDGVFEHISILEKEVNVPLNDLR